MSNFNIDNSLLKDYKHHRDDLDFYSYKIISKRRNFIFLEYPKTASSSLKTLLLPYLYAEYKELAMYIGYKIKQKIKKLIGREYSQWPLGTLGDHGWRLVIPEAHFVGNFYDPLYDSYFKFSIIRNPFDKMVSAYKHGVWGLVDPEKELFEEFISSLLPGGKRELTDLSDRGKNHFMPWTVLFDINRTDFVIRFENLENDLKIVLNRIGIKSEIPKENVSRKFNEYRSYYNDYTRKIVEDLYHEDLEVFNYDF